MSSLVILTGSPGTGKTTVAARLAKTKPRGLHIPSDIFYTFRPQLVEKWLRTIGIISQSTGDSSHNVGRPFSNKDRTS